MRSPSSWPVLLVGAALLALVRAPARAQTLLYDVVGVPFEGVGAVVLDGPDVDLDGSRELWIGAFLDNGNHGKVHVRDRATGAIVDVIPAAPDATMFGAAIADVGDVDGDGVSDVLVGAWDNFDGPIRQGAAYVYSGATRALRASFHGDQLFRRYGFAVAGAGDVDGDAVPDLIIAGPGSGVLPGIVDVRSGATGAVLYTLGGGPGSFTFGHSLASLDDIDGDGAPEFAVGAPASLGSPSGTGRVEVRSGSTGALLYAFQPAPASVAGWSLANAGDVDADGHDDLVVGAPGEHSLESRAYVVSAATGSIVFELTSDCNDDEFGTMVAGGRDVDGDARPDVAVSTRLGVDVHVHSGATGARIGSLRSIPGNPSGQPLGLALLDDVDGDGRAEVAVGMSRHDQAGTDAGRVRVYSGTAGVLPVQAFCFGDGSAGPCPCANPGATGSGCANPTGSGAQLQVNGSTSVSTDLIYFTATGLSSAFAFLIHADATTAGGIGQPMFGGLSCLSGTLIRTGTGATCLSGGTRLGIWGPGLRRFGRWPAGSTRYFQAFYYINLQGPCATNNLTNAVAVVFTP